MFLGHVAIALISKKVEPRISLATSIAAAELADILFSVLVLTGVERLTIAPGDTVVTPLRFDSYPYSHSLFLLVIWGLVFGGLHFLVHRRIRAALILGALVVSHWWLDVASHRPDMPLAPWMNSVFGLGLWQSVTSTVFIEGTLFLIGIWALAASTRAKDRFGRHGLTALLILVVGIYCASILGPPPPDAHSVGWGNLVGMFLLTGFAGWVDRHREPLRHSEPNTPTRMGPVSSE